MKLLLLGYSRIARKRILPALATLGVDRVDVASRTRSAQVVAPAGIQLREFDDYHLALSQSDATVVYVSTTNEVHAHWTEAALRSGKHAIVDKPALLNLSTARRVVALARERNLCVAEATTYAYHPQIQLARDVFTAGGDRPRHLVAAFSFPPLPVEDFRYRAARGGGALADLGPYAISPGRLFFGAAPLDIACSIIDRGDEVEIGFSCLAVYPEGRTLLGKFSFNSDYRNRLEVLGGRTTVSLDRVFSPPADADSHIVVRQNDERRSIRVPAADQFAPFLQHVFLVIQSGSHEQLGETLLVDAAALEHLHGAATRGTAHVVISA